MSLQVAIDARPLTTSRAGVATYCRGLIDGLRSEAGDARIALYAKEGPPADLLLAPPFRWQAMPAPLWLPAAVPRALAAGRVDVFHGTNHMAPPVSPVPTVITVHDLSAVHWPQYHTWRNRLFTVPQMRLSLRRAARLIAVSEATARDLACLPGIAPERIRVIPEAASVTPATPAAIASLVERLRLPRLFFLFLGALEPRKNVRALVQALGQLHASGHGDAHLVIGGAEGWHNHEVHAEVVRLRLEEAVHFIGYVPAADVPALYGASLAFVYPSLFEGFGLPPLEAMASGASVITSRTSSLPEVVGDAALLVDPRSVDDLASAMRRVLDDTDLRTRLQTAGLRRAALFSWERTARQTLDVYREAAMECRMRRYGVR